VRRQGACAAALATALLAALAHAAAAAGPGAGRPGAGRMGALREQFTSRFVGTKAPEFALFDMAGRTVRLSDLRGKVVLLNFWYSSCPPCRTETPDLIKLRQRNAARGFEVLGINLDPVLIPQAAGLELRRFVREFKVPYPVLLADRQVFQDYGEIPIQPISFLIDGKGVVARVFWGALPGPELERAIAPYLVGRDGPTGPPPARP